MSPMSEPRPSDVFDALHGLLRSYRAHLVRTLSSVHPELTFNAVRALTFIGHNPGARQKELVQHSGADKAQIARMLSLLQDKGWLERLPNDHDKRSRCLALSAEGQALYQALQSVRHDLAITALQGVDAAQQQALVQQCLALRDNLERSGAQGQTPPRAAADCARTEI